MKPTKKVSCAEQIITTTVFGFYTKLNTLNNCSVFCLIHFFAYLPPPSSHFSCLYLHFHYTWSFFCCCKEKETQDLQTAATHSSVSSFQLKDTNIFYSDFNFANKWPFLFLDLPFSVPQKHIFQTVQTTAQFNRVAMSLYLEGPSGDTDAHKVS